MLGVEMRVVYVGVSRGKEKMMVIGRVKDVGKKGAGWCEVKESPEVLV